ncbi:hypothetical protein BTO30_04995 [Domibacillus antri]|uniref:Stage III sporulation protein AF n=1 Tax=Domibacillus antri TaxID=1714264 RepID=A0A1Q8Q7K9_9BACI|nr:stage III sporulation protein AF [Domibacillus antri]OLN23326.1 hypothetical protein BTO30_04995 [Domibacillus antri]
MQSIFDWLTSVLAILLCAAAVDMLIPETAMQKYVRLAAGLVIMTAIVSPIFSLFTDVDFSLGQQSGQKINVFEQQTDRQLTHLMKTESLRPDSYLEPQLLKEAQAALQSYPSCTISRVDTDIQQNEIKNLVFIVQETAEGGCPKEKLINMIAQKWNMDAGQLNMVIQKGDSGGE